MSIRLRVLALVVLAVVGATAATAWLTLSQATQQITASAEADRVAEEEIARKLRAYARNHGTWEGVPGLVAQLADATGQRLRLVTTRSNDEVIVDTDHLAGRAARDTIGAPLYIDARHYVVDLPEGGSVTIPPDLDPDVMVESTVDYFRHYRQEVGLRACLTRAGVPLPPVPGSDPGPLPSVPAYLEPAQVSAWEECLAAASQGESDPVDTEQFEACEVYPAGGRWACLQEVVDRLSADFAPPSAYLYLGAVEEPAPAPLAPAPIVVAAAGVGLLAAGGALLITRRLLRPIGALTGAARRLGAGDLSERVPVSGKDELAVLARTFNHMADSLQRGEERQRRLAADVAHELRTPLANLRGYLEALKDGVIDPDPEVFVSLHEEAMLQQRIVDDLQDLALAEAGSLAYHPAPVELGELLETCRLAHQAAAEAAGVTLTVDAAEGLTVKVDPDRLRQVVGNLVTNALRATGSGGEVRLAAGRRDGGTVVTVTDTGHGIAPADLPHLFDRFWRADPARTRGTGGSGLGLAIARQIVTDHGGTITVQSQAGVGTRFNLTLPAAAEPAVLPAVAAP